MINAAGLAAVIDVVAVVVAVVGGLLVLVHDEDHALVRVRLVGQAPCCSWGLSYGNFVTESSSRKSLKVVESR